MSDYTRREFLRQSLLIAAGIAFLSCEDELDNTGGESPGKLIGRGNPKKVIIIGAGLAGLVAGYELKRAGHEIVILEARDRIGGRVFTIRSPFSEGHFAEAGAARIPPNHDLTLGYAEHFNLPLDPFYARIGSYVRVNDGEKIIVSNSDFLSDRPWPGSVLHKDYLKIRGGSDKLPQAFYQELKNQIQHSIPIVSIKQDAGGVVVRSADGNDFTGDRALCTVPVSVWHRIVFEPGLSKEKEEARKGGFRYAPSTRIFIQFKNRFWEKEGLNGWGTTDWPEEIWQPTWDRDGDLGILMSYLRWNRAEELDSFSKKQRIESVLNRWEPIFSGVKDHFESGMSHAWALERWSGGAWASPTVEQEAALGSHIGVTEGKVHFAGEHASGFHGWMQGALSSGLRAAREIHENE